MINSTSGNAGKQRVLIIGNQLLLGAGIESLLTQVTDLEVATVALDDGVNPIKVVEHFQPDVIIFDETAKLSNATMLLKLLKHEFISRLILVNPYDNVMCLYVKRPVLITHATDLTRVIRHSDDLHSGQTYKFMLSNMREEVTK